MLTHISLNDIDFVITPEMVSVSKTNAERDRILLSNMLRTELGMHKK